MAAPTIQRGGIVGVYVTSALALAMAPALMPDGYSWIEHTTSESAAQGLEGAWLARLGFLLFGFAVIATVLVARHWSRAARMAHAAFGVLMIAAAAFASRPADPAAPYVTSEDVLHSAAATAMGFAFVLGVLLVAFQDLRRRGMLLGLDAVAVVAAVVIPLSMVWSTWAGASQRLMFAIAFTWYVVATATRPSRSFPPARVLDLRPHDP